MTNNMDRPDTAASITNLVGLLRNAQNLSPELRVLDLCTGTGCIPLLFQHELLAARKDIVLRILGVDISNKALNLAYYNLQKVYRSAESTKKGNIRFIKADILMNPFADLTGGPLPLKTALNYTCQPPFWDILISNPPYISPTAYWKTTTRSVRGFEPKLALVPPSNKSQTDTEQGDAFYPRLIQIARDVEAKIVLLEVADLEQALRVARGAQSLDIFDGIEIWREQPTTTPDGAQIVDGFSVVGEGNARSVICWRGVGASWLGKEMTTNLQVEDPQQLLWSPSKDHFPTKVAGTDDLSYLEPQFKKNAPS